MKKLILYLSLLILPVFLFALAYILKEIHGPYYLWWYDQSYAYLVNSLNITQLKEVGGVAHPGTPLQILGALIMKIKFYAEGGNFDLVKDVFYNSESYLLLFHTILILINSIALFILGIITYRYTNNLFQSLILQLSPFTAFFIYYGLLIVSSEQFLILTSICLISLSVFYLYNNNNDDKPSWKLIIISSFICGIGLASKLNFFPLLFIPLIIIRGIKYKFLFCMLVSFIFIIFMIPLLSQYEKLLGWVKDLFIHNGQSAYAQPVAFNLQSFINNIFTIFSEDLYFMFAYLITLISLVISIIIKNDTGNPLIIRAKILLSGIFISFNVQLILVAKYYTQYFMIPSLMLSNLSLLVSIIIQTSAFHIKSNSKKNFIYTILIILNLSYGIYIFDKWNEILKWNIDEAKRTGNYIKTNHTNEILISTTNSANLDCVLEYSTHCSGGQAQVYKKILSNIVSNKIFYDPGKNKINYLCEKSEADSILCNNNKLIFQAKGEGLFINFLKELSKTDNIKIIDSKELFRNEVNEYVYQVSYNCELKK